LGPRAGLARNQWLVIEACAAPWDYEPQKPSPIHIECLEFEANGIVRKKFHDGFTSSSLTLSSNQGLSEQQMATISATIKEIYAELKGDNHTRWLNTPKMPITSAVMSYIKLYSGDTSRKYTVTVYQWGADNSPEAKRLAEIFEQLKSFSTSNDDNSKQN
jgi:hypothetical protein